MPMAKLYHSVNCGLQYLVDKAGYMDQMMVKYWPADQTNIGPIVDQCVSNMISVQLLPYVQNDIAPITNWYTNNIRLMMVRYWGSN